jgi:WD40 repeat protein
VQYPLESDRNGSPDLPKGFVDWKIWNYSEKGSGAEYGVGAVGANEIFLEVYNGTPLEMGEWLGMNAFTIYDRLSGKSIHPKQVIEVTSPNSIAFSPDGSYLATAGEGTVSLLDAGSGEEISSLFIGGRTVLSLNFMPDVRTLIIGTDNGTILLWDLGLLEAGTDTEPAIALACSQVKRDFTDTELQQYFGDLSRRTTCSSP